MCYMQHMGIETSFRRWRRQMGFTQDQAAEELSVSKSQVANWDAGKDRSSGRPAMPPVAIRRVMTAIAMDEIPQPWPE